MSIKFDELRKIANWWDKLFVQANEQKDMMFVSKQANKDFENATKEEKQILLLFFLQIGIMQEKSYYDALELLSKYGEDEHLTILFNKIKLCETNYGHYYASLIRTLAKSSNKEHIMFIEKYIYHNTIDSWWSIVAWALWPNHKLLFSHAFYRYFSEVDSSVWKDTVIITAFFENPAALNEIKSYISNKSKVVWSNIEKSIKSCLNNDIFFEDENNRIILNQIVNT